MAIELLDARGRPLIPQALPTVTEQKSVTGFGVTALSYGWQQAWWAWNDTPQRKAFRAAALYATHDSVRKAESTVSETGGACAWHLEDAQDDAIEDTADPRLLAIRNLLERPQALIPRVDRQPGIATFRNLLTLTLRHMGLCGTAFWYLNETDRFGIPLSILYLPPWRLYETRERGTMRLLGWTLDKPLEEGGRPLEMDNVLAFYLSPPDQGAFASGLVEAAAGKIPLAGLIDRHLANVLAAGGRLAGLISPKQGTVVAKEEWEQFVRDYRNITSDPAAALKLQIVQGAVDFVKTAADMDELRVVEIDERTDARIRELWKVPGSQTGKEEPAGLNSGSTKSYDEAVLWQKAIHPRLVSVYETLQYELLDRFRQIGTPVEFVFDEPQFDDDSPQYAKAVQAINIPLTNDERRAIVNLDPLEDAELGKEVWMTSGLTRIMAQAEEPPPPPVTQLPPQTGSTEPPVTPAVKAGAFERLRRSVDLGLVPKVRRSVEEFLAQQKADILERLDRMGLEHLRRKPNDARWFPRDSDERLAAALEPHLSQIVGRVARETRTKMGKALAPDEFSQRVVTRVLTRGGSRITGINNTTREAVKRAISEVMEDAQTIDDIKQAVSAIPVFDPDRAELIARTESMFAYNAAALGSYTEAGITQVQAIDGDGDEECAARDGVTFSIEEAENIEDHPNGTLDWVPVIPEEEPEEKATPIGKAIGIEYDDLNRIAGWRETAVFP